MQPRTKIQHEVSAMNRNLIDIKSKIETWAFSECNEKVGIATKSKFWCIDCGDEHPISLVKNDKAVCPGCNANLTITKSRKRKFDQSYWVAFAELSTGEILGEVQVIRLFEVRSYHALHRKPKMYIQENIRQFIPSDHSKIQYVARKRNMGQGYPCYGDLEIRKIEHYNGYIYNPYPYKYHPWSSFKPQYEKLGINKDLQGLTFLTASQTLMYNSKAETLIKQKQYSLLGECSNNSSKVNYHWPSIKIAMRNKYKIEDAGMWLDYLDLLNLFGKDLRSPKYICPKDLKKEHDRYVAKKKAQDKKLRLQEQKKKLIQDQKEYAKARGVFFGIRFTDGDLEVKVLESVKEFLEQGETLQHCVYANSYYKKKESLVLAAFKDGTPLETIELNIEKMEIVQSRGLHNNPSPFNTKIKQLVQNNLHVIQNARSQLAV
jgi:hypothetical protein